MWYPREVEIRKEFDMPDLARTPPYLQIARSISEQIAKGILKPGDKLPSERELMDEWDISKATAGKVVSELKSEGLAVTRVGVGTRVASRAVNVGIGPRDMFARLKNEGRIRLPSERSERTVGEAPGYQASEHVCSALGATPESNLVWRKRVIYRDEKPYSIAVSWFLPALLAQRGRNDIIARLMNLEAIPEGTPKFIGREIEREVDEGVDFIEAIEAEADVAAPLRIDEGSPVLRVVSTIYAESWPIEVGEYFYPKNSGLTYRYSV
jgi:DNA-binding GntR family transcriptional regulator